MSNGQTTLAAIKPSLWTILTGFLFGLGFKWGWEIAAWIAAMIANFFAHAAGH